jgi:hypothetical protein
VKSLIEELQLARASREAARVVGLVWSGFLTLEPTAARLDLGLPQWAQAPAAARPVRAAARPPCCSNRSLEVTRFRRSLEAALETVDAFNATATLHPEVRPMS